jgi:VWFA-related protein
MGAKMLLVRQAVAEVVRSAGPLDEYAMIKSLDRPVLLSGFAGGAEALESIALVQAKGRSALLDAIYLGVQQMKTARNARRVVLVLSDGGDNSSRYSEAEIMGAAREAGIRVYTIGFHEPLTGRGRSAVDRSGPELLARLAEHTGGRHFAVERGNLETVAIELTGAARGLR